MEPIWLVLCPFIDSIMKLLEKKTIHEKKKDDFPPSHYNDNENNILYHHQIEVFALPKRQADSSTDLSFSVNNN